MMRFSVTLLLLLITLPANAFSWHSLWQNANQQGASALQSGDPRHAAELFQDKDWQGVSHYRAGQFQKALKSFAPDKKNSDSLYNRGNSLAHLGEYKQAIAAYEQVLKIDPKNKDARFNRDLLKKLQKKQQSKKSPQQQQQKQKDQQQQDKQQLSQQPQAKKNKPQQQQAASKPKLTRQQREQQQAKRQILRRVPDEPGSLLGQIFQRDYQRHLVTRYKGGDK